jgi:hypothetical protein
MKPERIILLLTWLLLVAGLLVRVTGYGQDASRLGGWIWLAAFSVLCLPLIAWLVDYLIRKR